MPEGQGAGKSTIESHKGTHPLHSSSHKRVTYQTLRDSQVGRHRQPQQRGVHATTTDPKTPALAGGVCPSTTLKLPKRRWCYPLHQQQVARALQMAAFRGEGLALARRYGPQGRTCVPKSSRCKPLHRPLLWRMGNAHGGTC